VSYRDPRLDRQAMHPLAQAFQRQGGGPMAPTAGWQGLPPDLMPERAPGQGLGVNYNPQVPPIAVMTPGDTAPDQLLRVRSFEAIAPGAEGPARAVEFPDDGWVIGIIGVPRQLGTVTAQPALQFRATVGEEVGQLVTTGLDATFATFSIFGSEWEWQPMARRVTKLERWNFTVRNVGDTLDLIPDITLKFRALRSPGMYAPQMLGPELSAQAPIVVVETAPDRIVRVEGLTDIAPGVQGNVRTVQFPEDGYCTAILATPGFIETGGPLYATAKTSVGVQIQLGDTGGFFTTDGQASDFALLSCWGNQRAKWMPYFRAVSRLEKYSVSGFNFNTDDTFAGPEVLFKFRSIRSLQR